MVRLQAQNNRALLAYRNGQFRSLRASVQSYGGCYRTLLRRQHGTPAKEDTPPMHRKLSDTEETTLVEWILDMDTRGLSVTKALIQQMAELFVIQHQTDASNPTPSFGVNWTSKFIKRHPVLQLKYNRKYDYQRALCEDPKLINQWFLLVRNTVAKWGIQPEDIYNFDETGFQMGVITTAKVVTSVERSRTRPRSIQPGNRQWTTAIECIGATGRILPPMLLFKGKLRQKSWYENIPKDWTIEVSDNGWTTDDLGYLWLTTVFDKHTRDCTMGSHRLLILDGHGSHNTLQFDQYCKEHKIIVLCMPPHSSHLLQPCDVGCFAPLKRFYRTGVSELIRTGIDYVDKLDFLTIYQAARLRTFTPTNIRSAFATAGIVPYDPQRVVCKLQVEIRPVTPSRLDQLQIEWTSATPRTIVQLQSQIKLVDTLVQSHTNGPASPTVQAWKQLAKGAELAMNSVVLLTAENSTLRTANEKVRKKRIQKRSYVPREVLSTPADVLQECSLVAIQVVSQSDGNRVLQDRLRQRAPNLCSICRSPLHTARICPERVPIN